MWCTDQTEREWALICHAMNSLIVEHRAAQKQTTLSQRSTRKMNRGHQYLVTKTFIKVRMLRLQRPKKATELIKQWNT